MQPAAAPPWVPRQLGFQPAAAQASSPSAELTHGWPVLLPIALAALRLLSQPWPQPPQPASSSSSAVLAGPAKQEAAQFSPLAAVRTLEVWHMLIAHMGSVMIIIKRLSSS